MTSPLGFLTLNPLPGLNVSELPPITASNFTTRTPENTSLINQASTSNNPDPMISLTFVEANYEVIKSLLRERRRQGRNEDIHNKLEYFSEEYDEEREMEPRPMRVWEATPIPQVASSRVRRQKERVVEFEDAPNREGSKATHEPSFLGSGGSSSFGGPPTYYSYGGYDSQAPAGGIVPASHGLIHPLGVFPNRYPFNAQPMYPFPNAPIYPNQAPSGLFTDYTDCVTPFVHWIEDYPLLDGLKMPSHVGSYDGKRDPDNFLHLFEGAIRMQKWAMPEACHMFTYTLKDSTQIWWNGQKTGSILNYEDLKAKFRSHFSQQKKFTKTHLIVHNIKQKEGESARAFVTRSLRVDSKVPLVDFSGEHSWPLGEVPLEITIGEGPFERTEVLNFVIVRSNSLHNLILRRTAIQKMGIVVSTIHRAIKFHTPEGVGTVLSTYEHDKTGEGQKKLKETSQEATKDIPSCMNTIEEVVINDKYPDQTVIIGRQLPTSFKKRLRDLLKANTDIFAWTYSDMMGISRTIKVGGRPLITEHRLNELKHIELRKQKKMGLAPERSEALHKEVEELTYANILRESKYQTWESNPILIKKRVMKVEAMRGLHRHQ
ncbi:reverse transcriptase domain-containing protein [Tanacetum coccineum]|uniref:Reverse transcriptase domain-containing protein n=1 Tax=Tanacetum coccineum TaxID=301880 RepID=A0ABQ5GM12_9ASTR